MRRILPVIVGILVPIQAFAYRITDSGWDCRGFLKCGSSTDAVTQITLTIVTGVTAFIGALAVVVFMYGAVRMVTSQGDEGKEAGKKALIWASLGLVAAILTGAVIRFVTDYLYLLGT